MTVQEMVPFLHSAWFSFELTLSALTALPDISMITLCPLWVLQRSRISLTYIPCKYHYRADLLSKQAIQMCLFQLMLWCFTVHYLVCIRMLRGASMMQDFPILTWTNNLESLWVKLECSSCLIRSCLLCVRN